MHVLYVSGEEHLIKEVLVVEQLSDSHFQINEVFSDDWALYTFLQEACLHTHSEA